MVKRGLWLVYDLYFHLQLDLNITRLRKVLVDALELISDLCHKEEIAATDLVVGSQSTLRWWQEAGDQVLKFLAYGLSATTADPVIRDAAENAGRDLLLRIEWRNFWRARRLDEAIRGVLD